VLAAFCLVSTESIAQAPVPHRPVRTFATTLTSEGIWGLVRVPVVAEFATILREDPIELTLEAVGPEYSVQAGLGSKRQRRRVTLRLRRVTDAVYECFVHVDVEDYYVFNQRWTAARGVDTSLIVAPLAQKIASGLTPYFKKALPP
jgi:hypothetical protein